MKVGDKYLCKKDYVVRDCKTYNIIIPFHKDVYYRVRWTNGRLAQLEYGDEMYDVSLFHITQKKTDNYQTAFCEFFYTDKEMRNKKIKEIMNENKV